MKKKLKRKKFALRQQKVGKNWNSIEHFFWKKKKIRSLDSRMLVGDHVSLHAPLDGGASLLRHVLLAKDPSLRPLQTPHGSLYFAQVGQTAEIFHTYYNFFSL